MQTQVGVVSTGVFVLSPGTDASFDVSCFRVNCCTKRQMLSSYDQDCVCFEQGLCVFRTRIVCVSNTQMLRFYDKKCINLIIINRTLDKALLYVSY